MTLTMVLPVLYNAAAAVLFYLAEEKTPFGRLSRKTRQTAIGVVFGLLAILSSTNLIGVDIGSGVIINVRDASPICAALIFGGPAGIIAGLIAGVYRFTAPFFGLAGTYTQVACTISTIVASFFAAWLRKVMFDDKKATWIYGIGAAVICEVFHMLMIFFTNMNDADTAFTFVQNATLPMVLYNALAVGFSIIAVTLVSRERALISFGSGENRRISKTFQKWLFIFVVIAYVLTSSYTYILQSRMSDTETESVITTSINDVKNDISDASDENLLEKTRVIANAYIASPDKSADFLVRLAEASNTKEINIVGADGFISNSSVPDYVGFDMRSGEQSNEFLIINEGGVDHYVQPYMPHTHSDGEYRKYAGVALPDGGFIQAGYDYKQFKSDIDSFVGKIARNRHIDNSGFIVICDSAWNIVTTGNEYEGRNLKEMGIWVDTDAVSEQSVFETKFGNTSYFCEYAFVEGYYIFGAVPISEAQFMRNVSVYLSLFMEILIFAVLFILIYFLIKSVILNNINKINGALSKITGGDLDVTVDVRTNREFASLSDDINSTVDTLKRYISEAEARIDKELEFAKQIQYSAMPTVFPPFPARKEFDVYAQMFTAKEVGGDFYDFYMLSDSSVGFVIADVSGKGIPAAMFMMRAKSVIKDMAESGVEVERILTEANERLCESNDAGMFVTAWIGILDLKTGMLTSASAGHNPPVICRADGTCEAIKQKSGFVLGGMEGMKYRKHEMQLKPGDQIFVYTDGVTEANDENEDFYGEERMLKVVGSNAVMGPEGICRAVKSDLDIFAGGAPQFDDITMLCFTLNYVSGDNSIEFIPGEKSTDAVIDFTNRIKSKLDVVPRIGNRVSIAIDEIYANILNHSKATMASITWSIDGGKLYLKFTDNGIPYNPLDAPEPDITLSAEDRQIGGLGILLVRKMTESMEYVREDDKNILTLTVALL